MRKEINFPYPFAGYAPLDFINCFASTYMCIEGYDGTEDCYCGHKLKVCESCKECKASPGKKQEELFFYFGTMTGRNSLRQNFDGQNEMQKLLDDTDELIDFTIKLAGYRYRKIARDFGVAILKSIDAGRPVLARMKDLGNGSFRVISGYDGGKLICPDPGNAQRKPEGAPRPDEIEGVYVVTGRTARSVSLVECLERIIGVMEYNRDHAIWDECIRQFSYWPDMANMDFQEIKRCFKLIGDIGWYTFNCWNFTETFRRELYHRIEDKRLRNVLARKIGKAFMSTHDRAWQLIAAGDCRDWTRRQHHELERAMCNNVVICLEMLKKNDQTVLETIKEALNTLKQSYPDARA